MLLTPRDTRLCGTIGRRSSNRGRRASRSSATWATTRWIRPSRLGRAIASPICTVGTTAVANAACPRRVCTRRLAPVPTRIGSIRVVSMNTEVDFSPSSPQAAWLERELSAIDRSKTPWVILGGHRPGIIDSTDGPDDRETAPGMKNPSDLFVMDELQRDVWPLLVKYGVDLAFWGHNHVYQRSCAWRAIGQGSFNASDGCVSYSQKGADGVGERRRRHGRGETHQERAGTAVRGEGVSRVWVHSTHRGGRDETARDVPRGWIRREWKGLGRIRRRQDA